MANTVAASSSPPVIRQQPSVVQSPPPLAAVLRRCDRRLLRLQCLCSPLRLRLHYTRPSSPPPSSAAPPPSTCTGCLLHSWSSSSPPVHHPQAWLHPPFLVKVWPLLILLIRLSLQQQEPKQETHSRQCTGRGSPCNEHGTIYAISSNFSDRMTTQSMGLMFLLSEHF